MSVQAVQRWRAETRWYEAYIVQDLLGDWTVVRRWGGRTNQLHGQRIEVVSDAPGLSARGLNARVFVLGSRQAPASGAL